MTREQTEHGVQVALQNLARKSVRKACKDAGISVTTLYNKTTPEQRDEALKGKPAVKIAPNKQSKRGRPKSVKPNPSAVPDINTETTIDLKYVAKLERALLQRILDKELQ